MTLDGTEKVQLAGGEASLFAFTQHGVRHRYKKLIFAFGDEKKTVLVTGILNPNLPRTGTNPSARASCR